MQLELDFQKLEGFKEAKNKAAVAATVLAAQTKELEEIEDEKELKKNMLRAPFIAD